MGPMFLFFFLGGGNFLFLPGVFRFNGDYNLPMKSQKFP